LRYRWENCPRAVRGQVEEVVSCVRENLKGNLAGVYLHGSIAFGCFDPRGGDIDLLIVSERAIARDAKRAIVKCLLDVSGRAVPIEVTFVSRVGMRRWRYPTSFEIHFSESWRAKYTAGLDRTLDRLAKARDGDLAIQIATASQRGICLYGRAAERVLPIVPESDLRASVVQDFYWARKRISEIPVYFVLNACRGYSFLETGRIFSKDEGCAWAIKKIPHEYRGIVRAARESYRRAESEIAVSRLEVRNFARWIDRVIRDANVRG
jgi:predicted nucleotidyltransferase